MPETNRHILLRCILFSAMGLLCSYTVIAQCNSDTLSALEQSQYDALMDIYNSTNGDNWKDNRGWGEDCDYCEWKGVVCGAQVRVLSLSLSNNNLTGNIPSGIKNLVYLTSLTLSNNPGLSGNIPPEIGELIDLHSLYLANCSFSGPLPREIGNLERLKNLFLEENNLSGPIPESIGDLTNISSIHLQNNNLSGAIPPTINNLQNLKNLYLNENNLSGSLPDPLSLSNIVYLNISKNSIGGPFPDISNCNNLYRFNFSNNQFSGVFPDIGTMPSLNSIEGSHNFFTEIDNLFELVNLKTLHFTHNRLGGNLNESISNLKNIRFITLDGNYFSGEIPESIGELTSLFHLYLSDNDFSGNIPQSFSNLTQAYNIIISNNNLSGCFDESLKSLCDYGVNVVTTGNCLLKNFVEFCNNISCEDYKITAFPEKSCSGERVSLQADGFSSWDYKWSNGSDRRIIFVYPEESETYSVTITNNNDCEFTASISVDVIPILEEEISSEICAGDEYYVGNKKYTKTGYYETVLQSRDGCDSIVYLDLSVTPPIDKFVDASFCEGEDFYFKDVVFRNPGYFVFKSGGNPCDTMFYLTLEEKEIESTEISEILCFGENIIVENEVFDQSGDYTISLTTSEGCDSIVLLDLTVLPEKKSFLQAEICEDDLFFIEDFSFDKSGNHKVVLESESGCDSTVELSLSVLPHSEFYFYEEICSGDFISVAGRIFNRSGYYEIVTSSANGCDSIIAFDLLQKEIAEVFIDTTFCFGQPIDFNGERIHLDGTFVYTTTGSNGCDSITTLDASVVDKETLIIEDYYCSYDLYEFGGFVFDDPGEYSFSMDNGNACLSQVFLTLREDTAGVLYFSYALCAGEELIHNGISYNRPGSFTHSFITNLGCERTDYIFIRSFSPDTTYEEVFLCPNESIYHEALLIDEPGLYRFDYVNQKGCDSIFLLTVNQYPVLERETTVAICPGKVFEYHGTPYEAGNYVISVPGEICDSIVYLNIIEEPENKTLLTYSICQGEVFLFSNKEINTTGTYVDTLSGTSGCDSIVELNLVVTEILEKFENIALCPGVSYSFFDREISLPGTYLYYESIPGACDIRHELNLRIHNQDTTHLKEMFCSGSVYHWNNQIIEESGRYLSHFINKSGCDSLVYLDVLFQENQVMTESITVCNGDTLLWHGLLINSPGIYDVQYKTELGCDSVHFVEVEFQGLFEKTLEIDLCPGEDFHFYDQVYNESGVFYNTVPGAVCDTTYTVNIEVRSADTTLIEISICENETYLWNNILLKEPGEYVASFDNDYGCDSLVKVYLSVDKIDTSYLYEQLCPGETYSLFGKTFTEAGRYSISSDQNSPCSPVYLLALEFSESDTSFVQIDLCSGSETVVNGIFYSSSGLYYQNLSNSKGCDSTLAITVALRSVHENYETLTICAGDSILWHNNYLNIAGDYKTFLTDQWGCDSSIVLNLTVEEQKSSHFEKSICAGEEYVFDGRTLSQSGTFSKIVENGLCDSIVVLELTVLENPENQEINVQLCPGQEYFYQNTSYTDPDTYYLIETNENGCPYTTILTINAATAVAVEKEILLCPGEGFFVNNDWIYSSGLYEEKLKTREFCDSIIQYDVRYYEETQAILSASKSLCGGEPVVISVSEPVSNILWSDGSKNSTLSISTGGTYFATVTDDNGCSKVLSTVIHQQAKPEIAEIKVIKPIPCKSSPGYIVFGKHHWLHSIDEGGSWFRDSIPVYHASNYSLSLTSLDSSCTWMNIHNLAVDEIEPASIDRILTSDNTNCISANGYIEIIPTQMSGYDLLYSIDNGLTFSEASTYPGLSAGTYFPVVKSKEGFCVSFYQDSVVINDPPEADYSLEILAPISCAGAQSGSIGIQINQEVNILWSTGETGPVIKNLGSGTYYVTVEDSYNCRTEDFITLEEGPSLDTWQFPADTTICSGDTLWLDFPTFEVFPVFEGDTDFIQKENILGFYKKGRYQITLHLNDFCFWQDELIIDEETQDFSGVDFLIGNEALVNVPVTAIDITWPLSDLSEWVLPESNITVIDQIENQIILSFSKEGTYSIGLTSFLGNCSTSLSKMINIFEDPSKLENQENHPPSSQKIVDFSLFPNPNNGSFRSKIILNQNSDILLIVVDHMGNRISEISRSGENTYIDTFDLDNMPSGIYALILFTDNQEKYILFSKI